MSPEEMFSIIRLVRMQSRMQCRDHLDVGAAGAEQLLAPLFLRGGADVKMVSALPAALHADQTHDSGHFFRRHRGCLSNRVSRYGGSADKSRVLLGGGVCRPTNLSRGQAEVCTNPVCSTRFLYDVGL